MSGFDWISDNEAAALIHFCWATVWAFTVLVRSGPRELDNGRRAQRAAENAALRDGLADARYQRTARHEPIDLTEWADPTEPPARARRRHWHTRLTWPGLNAGQLPVEYGDHLDPGRLDVDPCLAAPPDEDELAAWLTEDQPQSWPPLDAEGLMVERLLTEIEALDTRTWTVSTPDQKEAAGAAQ
jgi:hypothetical protein